MIYSDEKYFSHILSDAMSDSGITTCRGVEAVLIENGTTDINFRRVSEYKNGYTVPPFEKAKSLLSALKYTIDDSELTRILEESRERAKDVKEEFGFNRQKGIIKRRININLNEILSEFEESAAEKVLEKRVKDLYGDENMFSRYVNMLIKKDLEDLILTSEEVTNEQKD